MGKSKRVFNPGKTLWWKCSAADYIGIALKQAPASATKTVASWAGYVFAPNADLFRTLSNCPNLFSGLSHFPLVTASSATVTTSSTAATSNIMSKTKLLFFWKKNPIMNFFPAHDKEENQNQNKYVFVFIQ